MLDVSEETTTTDTEQAENPLQDLQDALDAHGNPSGSEGESEQPQAVDASEVEETPSEEAPEKPAEASDASSGEESEAEQTVNFDGFSDEQRATWERLHEAGVVTPDEIERARKESLFQRGFTKKTMALADDRKAWQEKVSSREDDLAKLDLIRSDPALLARWEKMDDPSTEASDSDEDLVDRKTAAELAREEAKRILEAKEAAEAKEQTQYNEKRDALVAALQESMETLGVDAKTMDAYITAEAELLPAGSDPVLDITPAEATRRVTERHEKAQMQAKIDELQGRISQKTTKAERTAKQSQTPARQVSDASPKSRLQQVNAEMGLTPNWSNVSGFGHPKEQQ